MARVSAGLLMYRFRPTGIEVLLVHPGGPFWRNKDEGAWTIPKGEIETDESPIDAAKREFAEETGHVPAGNFVPLKPARQKSGKTVHAWAVEGDLDTASIKSNRFKMEWPPRSGRTVEFPEVDRAEFFDPATARKKINPAQAAFVNELQSLVGEIDA